jgi:hypothetical protein
VEEHRHEKASKASTHIQEEEHKAFGRVQEPDAHIQEGTHHKYVSEQVAPVQTRIEDYSALGHTQPRPEPTWWPTTKTEIHKTRTTIQDGVVGSLVRLGYITDQMDKMSTWDRVESSTHPSKASLRDIIIAIASGYVFLAGGGAESWRGEMSKQIGKTMALSRFAEVSSGSQMMNGMRLLMKEKKFEQLAAMPLSSDPQSSKKAVENVEYYSWLTR